MHGGAHIKVTMDMTYNVTYYVLKDKMFELGLLCLVITQILLAARYKLIYQRLIYRNIWSSNRKKRETQIDFFKRLITIERKVAH